MSKNINISVTLKELTVLEFFVQKKYIKPSGGNSITASMLLDIINEEIREQNERLELDEEEVKSQTISRTVLYRMLKKFKEHGILDDGIKIDNAKTYYITLKGVQFYASLVDLSQDNTDQLIKAYEQINGKWGELFDNKLKTTLKNS